MRKLIFISLLGVTMCSLSQSRKRIEPDSTALYFYEEVKQSRLKYDKRQDSLLTQLNRKFKLKWGVVKQK